VLEVGTGSGYQAAVLAELGVSVWSIEIVPALARSAAARLTVMGYGNVTVREGDGYAGWPEEAPFDAVIVTAGADHVPQPLVTQLKPGGRMVIPIGPADDVQTLILIEKDAKGRVTRRERGLVRFVPLTRRR
jgi:protein-L-isoaspartate(D-aspartate) O-methyltransferase